MPTWIDSLHFTAGDRDDRKPTRYRDSIFTRLPFRDLRGGKWCPACRAAGRYTWLTETAGRFAPCPEHKEG